jgi:hypothetical protein
MVVTDEQLIEIYQELETMRRQMEKLTEACAQGLARPAGQGGTTLPRQRAEALFAHDEKWNAIKDRWPEFKVHPRACEAFERHVETLEGEPDLAKLRKAATHMDDDSFWPRQKMEARFKLSPEQAQAYLYFLKISGLATYVWRKGTKIKK